MPQPFTMTVELGKAREFARAVDHPGRIEVGDPVPVCFLQSMAFWTDPESSAFDENQDLSRMLHGQQAFTFPNGPIRVGEVLTGLARVDKTYTKEGKRGGSMHFTEVVVDFTGPDGELRAEVRGISIETEAAPV